jgi:hypothetical protein
LIAESLSAQKIVVATSHFESLAEGAVYRKEQMEIVFPLMDKYFGDYTRFVTGDFNFDNTWKSEYETLEKSGF